jgi:hypothetical protein
MPGAGIYITANGLVGDIGILAIIKGVKNNGKIAEGYIVPVRVRYTPGASRKCIGRACGIKIIIEV